MFASLSDHAARERIGVAKRNRILATWGPPAVGQRWLAPRPATMRSARPVRSGGRHADRPMTSTVSGALDSMTLEIEPGAPVDRDAALCALEPAWGRPLPVPRAGKSRHCADVPAAGFAG